MKTDMVEDISKYYAARPQLIKPILTAIGYEVSPPLRPYIEKLFDVNKDMYEALEAVWDSGLLNGLTILHDDIGSKVLDALSRARGES